MKFDVNVIRSHTESVHDYINEPSKAREAFKKNRAEYIINKSILNELKKFSNDYLIVVFSAEWCPDCIRNIPILDLLNEMTGIEVRVFGHLMRDSKSTVKRWAVPPSPHEVEEFGVIKIPLIVILNINGEKIGEIIENPPAGKVLEHAILDIINLL